MIDSEKLLKILKKNKIDFFTGVPDSVLKDLSDKFKKNHITVNNEGTAVALATGYFLSTKKIPCIYMQNSGLGNAINPIISIAHKKVYSIPSILIIGWRGSPRKKDEPQHLVKGRITKSLLKLLGIKFCILKKKDDLKKFDNLIKYCKKNSKTVACLIEKNQIIKSKSLKKPKKVNKYLIKRYNFIETLLEKIKRDTKIVSSTGFISRELNDILETKNYKNIKPFYMVGGMGHSSSVTLGIDLNSKTQNICLDGDGALLMHLGSMGITSKFAGKKFKHILFRNNSHESVGNQTTNSNHINYKLITKGLGFKKYYLINKRSTCESILKKFLNNTGPAFLEVRIKSGSIENLGRPKNLEQVKHSFMKN